MADSAAHSGQVNRITYPALVPLISGLVIGVLIIRTLVMFIFLFIYGISRQGENRMAIKKVLQGARHQENDSHVLLRMAKLLMYDNTYVLIADRLIG